MSCGMDTRVQRISHGGETQSLSLNVCVDENPDYTRGTHANDDGALFNFIE